MDYKEINEKLNEATALLDQVASEFAKAEFIQRKAWLKLIGKSMATILELQHGLYIEKPELRPPSIKKEPFDKAANRQLGDILIGIQGILAKNKPIQAIKIIEEFIEKNPPDYLAEIAKGEIDKIKKDFSV
jgi:hypothetical protein